MVPVAELLMPLKVQTAVVVPYIPIAIELLTVVLPIKFPEMVKLPVAPAVSIPLKV